MLAEENKIKIKVKKKGNSYMTIQYSRSEGKIEFFEILKCEKIIHIRKYNSIILEQKNTRKTFENLKKGKC